MDTMQPPLPVTTPVSETWVVLGSNAYTPVRLLITDPSLQPSMTLQGIEGFESHRLTPWCRELPRDHTMSPSMLDNVP